MLEFNKKSAPSNLGFVYSSKILKNQLLMYISVKFFEIPSVMEISQIS